MKLIAYGKTDIGKKRKINEDNFIIINLDTGVEGNLLEPTDVTKGLFFMVADGLGGAVSGEIASRLAVNCASEYIKNNFNEQSKIIMKDCLMEANRTCHNAIRENSDLHGMGTVATACLLNSQEIIISQVGDTRMYLYREEKLIQITEDQNYYNEIKKRKIKDPDIIREFGQKHIVTQAIGSMEKINPVVIALPIQSNDKIFICSDGLHGLIELKKLNEILSYKQSPQTTINELIEIANENGGTDNITGILVELI
ncbi:MAG: serine/threonine-protein phosphatase [Leptospiraceae bacterium]|nr:serine/threonine-protein phosphatase [Leptospiraceae bacterium]